MCKYIEMPRTGSIIFIPILIRKSKQADLTNFSVTQGDLSCQALQVLRDKVLYYKSTNEIE